MGEACPDGRGKLEIVPKRSHGDERDAKQWLEGPYSQSLTVRELIEHKRDTIRARRRATFYKLPVCKSWGVF